jgi:hypothetical protein
MYHEITLLQRQKPQTIKQWQATKQLANLYRVLGLNRQASLQAHKQALASSLLDTKSAKMTAPEFYRVSC